MWRSEATVAVLLHVTLAWGKRVRAPSTSRCHVVKNDKGSCSDKVFSSEIVCSALTYEESPNSEEVVKKLDVCSRTSANRMPRRLVVWSAHIFGAHSLTETSDQIERITNHARTV